MLGAYNSWDYYYFNHSGKIVCFNYDAKKRAKTTTLNFIKSHHEQGTIIKYLASLDLRLEEVNNSKKYAMYSIVDNGK